MTVLVGRDAVSWFRLINLLTLSSWRIILPIAPALVFAVFLLGGLSGSISWWAIFVAGVAINLGWALPILFLRVLAPPQYPRGWYAGAVLLRHVDIRSARAWQELNGADLVKISVS